MTKDIYTAISHDNVPFEEYLEEIEKCDINMRREGTGEGLLHYAVSNWSRPENTAYVEDMIQRGIDVNMQDENGNTVLHYLVAKPNLELAKIILGAGADPNLKNASGFTPLYSAASSTRSQPERYALLQMMMESGGRPEGEVMDVARKIGNQQVIAILEGEGYELPPETVSYYQKRVKELQSCFAASYGWGKEAFGILLSAPSCKVHSWNLTYLEIDHCESAGIQKLLKKSGVTDKDSFLQSYEDWLYRGAGKAYEDFASFWKGEPQFDLAKLGKKAKQEFQDGIEYAVNFKELVNDGGFYAWDYAETVALVRMAFTCGIIDKEEGLELLYRIVDEAEIRYDSWRQYAISYICGGAYTSFQNSKRDSMQGDMAFKSLSEIVQSLFEDKVWSHGL